MLKSFQIKRFRLFEHIEIKRLGRVNLVVGKNNSGKSTFLEAIELYASNASSSVLLNLIESRQNNCLSEVPSYSVDLSKTPLRHLFFDHHLSAIDEEGIVLGEVHSDKTLNINVAVYQDVSDKEGNIRKNRVRSKDLLLDEKYPELGAFFRLDNKNGSIKTTEYTAETLTDVIDMDVEVR